MSEEKKELTDAEQMVQVQEQLREAAEKLQKLRDKAAGVTRMSRVAWDNLTDAQRQLLEPAILKGQVILSDSIPEEENYQWKN